MNLFFGVLERVAMNLKQMQQPFPLTGLIRCEAIQKRLTKLFN